MDRELGNHLCTGRGSGQDQVTSQAEKGSWDTQGRWEKLEGLRSGRQPGTGSVIEPEAGQRRFPAAQWREASNPGFSQDRNDPKIHQVPLGPMRNSGYSLTTEQILRNALNIHQT